MPGPVSVQLMACHWIGLRNSADPLITRNQVELMRKDNIPEPDAPGFEALQILPQAIENILPQILQAAREKVKA